MPNGDQVIRSRAPLRVSFAGGGTDVSPYCDERGGAVLSTTIDRYAYCTIRPRGDERIRISSKNYGISREWDASGPLRYDGNLDLIKAVLNYFEVGMGFDMSLSSDAPPGSGLGGSSTVIVAIIGAVSEWIGMPLSQYEVAEIAYDLERNELGMPGGRQDQYAACFGGFNYIEFKGDDTIVTPLRVRKDILNELHYRFLLCYTGKTRDSGSIIESQSTNYRNREVDVVRSLDGSKALAMDMRNALMKGDVVSIGELLNRGWELKKGFTTAVTNEHIDGLYSSAIEAGAIGGKISGAGGGGFMFFICDPDRKHLVADELVSHGAEVETVSFEKDGLQTWRHQA